MTRKITLLILAIAAMFTANSQTNDVEWRKSPSFLSPVVLNSSIASKEINKKSYKAGVAGSAWYSSLSAYQNGGGMLTYYTGQPIWRDSLPVTINGTTSEINNIGTHAVGMMFDPKSELYNSPNSPETPALSKYNRYTVDSVRFFYKYRNFNPGSVDTLLVQFYNYDRVSRLVYRNQANQILGYADSPTYDKSRKIGISTSSVKILLTDANNTDSFFSNTFASFGDSRTVPLPAPINVIENRTFGFTVTFHSGVTAKMGDTIILNSTPLTAYPVKKLNTFQPRIFQENDNLGDTSYNYGLFSFSRTRYSTRTTEWFDAGASLGGSKKLGIDGDFFIRYFNVSAKEINGDGYGLGNVFPNPVTAGNDVKIEFALGKGENVNIQVFNILGTKVSDINAGKFGAGQNSVTINTANLAGGVYIYNINAGGFKASKKFTVTN